jgi:acyl-coenzyme A synthetase/AMP-(fatty) acid ligase
MDSLAQLGDAERAVLLDVDLRLVLSTGEALPWPLVRRWRSDFNRVARIINLYSQTETAGTVCTYEVPDALVDTDGSVPLGRPVAFTTIDLVDATLRPVPPGEIGEICVGGSRLGSGYVDAANAVSGGFVLRPFHHHGSFRTGDLARRRDDGVFEFAGRADQRIKVRGQRVDLLELETTLRSMPGIVDAAVVAHPAPDDARLFAYVATADGSAIEPAVMLAHLRRLLPSAALPEIFVHLASLPRNAAGKIDRSALPPPSNTATDVATPSAGSALAPRVERMFADALHLPGLDHNANFFDVGGNSLMASVLIARLRTAFATPLPITSFFDHPTVAAVAAAIEEDLLREIEALPEAEAQRLLGGEDGP